MLSVCYCVLLNCYYASPIVFILHNYLVKIIKISEPKSSTVFQASYLWKTNSLLYSLSQQENYIAWLVNFALWYVSQLAKDSHVLLNIVLCWCRTRRCRVSSEGFLKIHVFKQQYLRENPKILFNLEGNNHCKNSIWDVSQDLLTTNWTVVTFLCLVAGGLDGSFNGKKYFSCPKGRGIFIQVQDIVNVITRKVGQTVHHNCEII